MAHVPDDEQRRRIDPTEAHQDQLNAPLPGDDLPVKLTVYEAQKCQAVVNGYLDGLLGYEEGARRVASLLSVRALDATGSRTPPPIPGRSSTRSRGHRRAARGTSRTDCSAQQVPSREFSEPQAAGVRPASPAMVI